MPRPTPKQHRVTEKGLEAARRIDKVLGGKGVVITIGEPGGVISHFTSKLPPLVLETVGSKRSLKVEASSIETSDKALLHLLAEKIREG